MSNSEIDLIKIIYFKQDNVEINLWSLTIASLIWTYYNIYFTPSSIKPFTFIYYIINYTTNNNSNCYQKVIKVAIIKKIFNNYNNNFTINLSIYILIFNKFGLKIFYWFY